MLESLQEGAYNLLSNTRFWMILLLIIFFLVIAGYVYNKYVTPMVDTKFIANKEFNDKNDSSNDAPEVELIIFTVEWCPHSKKAIPIWNELK